MFEPSTFAAAFPCVLVSLICWGSWGNVIKYTKLPFALFYIDYALSILLTATLLALTVGSAAFPPQTGSGFIHTLQHNFSWANAGYAAAAGTLFNVANMLLVSGIELAGLSVAFPIAIGTALVMGTLITYWVQPKGNEALLFAGVALALVAIIMDGLAYRALGLARGRNGSGGKGGSDGDSTAYSQLHEPGASEEGVYGTGTNSTNGQGAVAQQRVGGADGEDGDDPSMRTVLRAKLGRTSPLQCSLCTGRVKGVVVCLVAGVLMGSWSPLTAKSMSGPHALTPYGSFWFYTLAACVSTIPLAIIFMQCPLSGEPCKFAEYKQAPWRAHVPGLIGGFIWAVGTLLNLVGGRAAGFAIAYAIGQSAPMVAALWGVYYKEMQGSDRVTIVFFALMFLFYFGAIGFIAASQ